MTDSASVELLETCRAVVKLRNRFAYMDVARAMVTLAEEAKEMLPRRDSTPGQLALHLGINRETQRNWRERDRSRWLQRMRHDLALAQVTTVGNKGVGRGRPLTPAQWEFVARVRSRNRFLDGEAFAKAVRDLAAKVVKEENRSDLGRLQAFSRVMAWRHAQKIQELAAEYERKKQEAQPNEDSGPVSEEVAGATTSVPLEEHQGGITTVVEEAILGETVPQEPEGDEGEGVPPDYHARHLRAAEMPEEEDPF